MNSVDRQSDPHAAVARRFAVWLVGGAMALFGVTWRLWTPQTVFPQIPFLEFGTRVPGWVDWVLFGVSLVALPVALFRRRRLAFAIFAISTTMLILLDQHRLQPWVYEFVLMAVVLATAADDRRAVFWLRLLVVGLYVHSAISKFDASFLSTHGRELVNAVFALFGMSLQPLDEPARGVIVFSLPLFELLIAVGLCHGGFRRTAVVGSIAMHLLLLVALGPWGLNHKPGVLIWNVFFIGQNVMLFWTRVERRESNVEGEESKSGLRLSGFGIPLSLPAVVIGAATILPCLEPFDLFDHWPAWGLYASRPERVSMTVFVIDRKSLPAEVREFADGGDVGSVDIDFDRWSLESLNAPIYPQGRFRLAVALTVAERANLDQSIRIVIESPADRRTGRRTRREITGLENLRRECSRYLINMKSR